MFLWKGSIFQITLSQSSLRSFFIFSNLTNKMQLSQNRSVAMNVTLLSSFESPTPAKWKSPSVHPKALNLRNRTQKELGPKVGGPAGLVSRWKPSGEVDFTSRPYKLTIWERAREWMGGGAKKTLGVGENLKRRKSFMPRRINRSKTWTRRRKGTGNSPNPPIHPSIQFSPTFLKRYPVLHCHAPLREDSRLLKDPPRFISGEFLLSLATLYAAVKTSQWTSPFPLTVEE